MSERYRSMTTLDDVRPVRSAEQLDWPRLASYLREHATALDASGVDLAHEVEVQQFAGGHSNLTYLLRVGGGELVLRRAPFGPVAATAHDMAREYRWLAALHPIFPLAPRPYVLCEDAGVLGAIFYLMERRRGVIVRADEPPALVDHPDLRRRVSAALIDALADLHAIDVDRHGLSGLGKPAGFMARQVRGWTERWQRSRTSDIADMDRVAEWLQTHLPGDSAPSVIHGDYKLDNVMLNASDPGRLTAVLDWEMCALGDPLVDLGILLTYWSHIRPGDASDALASVTNRNGWFTRDEIIECYSQRTGRDLSALGFYETFASFKVAVIIQQIYFRYASGQTDDPRFAHFAARVEQLAREARALSTRG
jgi:aminoglycoside phosphotransferase (APT) family kinase protein